MYKVYYLVSEETPYYYIGITRKRLNHRLNAHRSAARSGKKSPLYDCMRKHKFIIALRDEYYSKEECCNRERELIKEARDLGHKLLNLADGGEGGYTIPDHKKDEWREKLSKARKGKRPFAGGKHSEETKRVCGEAGKRRWEGKTYPDDVTEFSFKEAHEKYGISKTHYYRKLAEANALS
ncbi:MAG: GIY-YIG nuclease family protein [Gammaproteobacteria bacterium]|nr:GIY-YIG nuclease family protein [Gammaproteobacteria bacterium]MCW8983147.1 GIY-YIG nuclease family protein [Gammaproteobacteria bacterium]